MKRSLKMWSQFWLFLGVYSCVLTAVSLFVPQEFSNSSLGLIVFGVIYLLGILFGLYIFKTSKVVNGLVEQPILLESVYGVNVDSVYADGVLWDDIEKARTLLLEWKKKHNYTWDSKNLYDILVVCYLTDDKREMGVKVLKNTRLLEFKGIISKKNNKFKLDTLDLSNFNTSLLKDLDCLDNTNCLLKCVKPIDKKYLEMYFSNNSYETYVYNVEIIEEV